jgi:hypothetical protein
VAIPIPTKTDITRLRSHRSHPTATSFMRTLVPYSLCLLKYTHLAIQGYRQPEPTSCLHHFLPFSRNKRTTPPLLIIFYFLFLKKRFEVFFITQTRSLHFMPNTTSTWLLYTYWNQLSPPSPLHRQKTSSGNQITGKQFPSWELFMAAQEDILGDSKRLRFFVRSKKKIIIKEMASFHIKVSNFIGFLWSYIRKIVAFC